VDKKAKTAKKAKKRIYVDEQKFTDALRKLVNSGPLKREDVKTEDRKPGKIIRPRD